ncbi:MAG: cupin domain-containing protein [Candidatus Limnocylindrales bacterium]|nr:cupin domain-containing protein [Candidatus Limnocylindrales bacterium]
MPIEIRRFGVGHRRPDGPPGSVGLTGQVLHSDGRGIVAELAFARNARIEPHSNPNTAYFIVVEGGGWVGVGDERTRIAAGQAACWPPDVIHSAWTEHSEMRAFVVELTGADDQDTLRGHVRELGPGVRGSVPRADGVLAGRGSTGARPADADGEPA